VKAAGPAKSKKKQQRFIPLYDRLIVREDAPETVTEGGIIIPETAKGTGLRSGQVLLVGPGQVLQDGRLRPLAVKAGERVVFGEHGGLPIESGGEKLLLLRESELIGVVREV
jgi:chaperonin GroES